MSVESDQKGARVAGLLLAAGESQRMGETNKLLLPVGGEPLLTRSVELLANSALEPAMVVLGHRLEDSAPLVSRSGVPFVINGDYRAGQQSSLRVGLGALGRQAGACMVMLADLPRLRGETLDALRLAVQRAPDAEAWVPAYQGTWGNPRVIGAQWCDALRNDPTLTSRALFAAHPERVAVVEVDDPGVLRDIDTPDDYRVFLEESRSDGTGLH